MMRTDGRDCLAELKRRRDGVYYVVLVVYVCMRSVGADRLGNVSVFRTGADSVYAFFGGYHWNHGGNSLHSTNCFADWFGDSHRNCPEENIF